MASEATEEDEVLKWAIRLDSGALDADENARLEAWLDADPRRSGALLRVEATLAYLDRGRALARPQEAEQETRTLLDRRALIIGGLTAASLAALTVKLSLPGPDLDAGFKPMKIETALGELRRVPLSDGSVASVNTASRVTMAFSEKRRDVKLEDGEAWFQVAHDKARPFTVEAGEVRVRAVGTAFSVRKREGGADVLVTEGVVETWVVGHENAARRIAAGSKSFVAETIPAIEVVKASGEVDRALAWRTGELALNGESLFYAATELNRYNARKLVIDDHALGRAPIVGYFRTDQPEDFARAVGAMLGGRVKLEGDTIHLSRSAVQK